MIDKVGKGGKLYAHFTPDEGSDILARAVAEAVGGREVSVLDLCAGSGQLLAAVMRHCNVKSAVAVELDPEYVEQLQKRFGE